MKPLTLFCCVAFSYFLQEEIFNTEEILLEDSWVAVYLQKWEKVRSPTKALIWFGYIFTWHLKYMFLWINMYCLQSLRRWTAISILLCCLEVLLKTKTKIHSLDEFIIWSPTFTNQAWNGTTLFLKQSSSPSTVLSKA